MIANIILILLILFISIQFERKYKIIPTITLIILSFMINYLFPNFLSFTNESFFAEEMTLFIVILVLSDSFILKLKSLKENWLSIFILSTVFVILSVFLDILFKNIIFINNPDISIGELIALFAMITATDPVSVISAFKSFKMPHKLQTLAEGESLFNDAIALLLFFSIGLYMMNGNSLTFSYISTITIETFLLSTVFGLLLGFLGLFLLKTTKDLMGEFVLILFMAYLSFEVAENITLIGENHLSGLLVEIITILTMTTIIDKSYSREQKQIDKSKEIISEISSNIKFYEKEKINSFINKFTSNITDVKRQQDILSFLNVIGLLIIGILYISITQLINIDILLKYKYEILMSFFVTSLVRFLLIGSFSIISYKTKYIKEMNKEWFYVLFFSGIKGGLSIVMLHVLNKNFPDFEYKEMFESIVIGVIFLSTFIYSIGLMIIGRRFKKKIN